MTRVAVVDLGSNSTRLLIADVGEDGTVTECERRSIVTRLGQGVGASGRLADEAMDRVRAALAEYRALIDEHGAEVAVGVLTSAARDARNGAAFAEEIRDRYGIRARTIPGEQEARLTYRGATSGEHDDARPTAVIDIGGGSTEVVVGQRGELRFHRSTQVGVVRHSERHLLDDPPPAGQLRALREDAAATFRAEIPRDLGVQRAIAVAGTATQTAAILRTTTLTRDALEPLLARLAAVASDERASTPGLDPARAPTIVAGVAILLEAMSAVGVEQVTASDHDVLRGVALHHTAFR